MKSLDHVLKDLLVWWGKRSNRLSLIRKWFRCPQSPGEGLLGLEQHLKGEFARCTGWGWEDLVSGKGICKGLDA